MGEVGEFYRYFTQAGLRVHVLLPHGPCLLDTLAVNEKKNFAMTLLVQKSLLDPTLHTEDRRTFLKLPSQQEQFFNGRVLIQNAVRKRPGRT